jgi:hypothetical protein
MNSREAIKNSMDVSEMVCMAYLNDMNDDELMMRPQENCNHINWQIGHLISSDHQMVSGCLPDAMPALPEGFAEKYSRETCANNDAAKFCKKDELFSVYKQQRSAAQAALDKLSDDDLDKPAPEEMQAYAPSVGAAFNMLGSHWLMHAGQWAVVRRQAGKPIVM